MRLPLRRVTPTERQPALPPHSQARSAIWRSAVERVAREFVERYGKAEALRLLRDHAEVAGGKGDDLSAKAWGDIGDFAEGMEG